MTYLSEEDVEFEIATAIKENRDTLTLSNIEKGVKFPKSMLSISNLRHLSISYSYGLDIPSWLADIATLEILELYEGGDVSEFISNVYKLEQLRTLRIFFMSGLSEIKPTIKSLHKLKKLDISGADFNKFPKEIALLSNLESFEYIQCEDELCDIFDTLSQLPNLKNLNFSHYSKENGSVLPESFLNLHSLEEIHFVNWQELKSLPEKLGDMQRLKVIDLSNQDIQLGGYDAQIQALPESIGDLISLEVLDIFGCQDIKSLPANFQRLSTLKELDIIHSGIEDLSLTDDQWRNLETLRMQGTPPNFALCEKVKNFAWYAGGNQFAYGLDKRVHLPLEHLFNLEKLHLIGGVYKTLDFLEAMPKLRTLHLNCNFDHLPDCVCKLEYLEYIDIFGATLLKSLPVCLADMSQLKELHISNSGVQTTPYFLARHRDLFIDVR